MKNKFLYILIFILLFIFIFNSFVFAASYPSVSVDSYKYYFIFTYKNNTFLVTTDNNTFVVGHGASISEMTVFYLTSSKYNSYILSSNTWEKCSLGSYSLTNPNTGYIVFQPSSLGKILYSNFNIIYDDYWSSKLNNSYYFLKSVLPVFKNPYIANNAEDLATGTFDYLLIFPGDLTPYDTFKFVLRKKISITIDGGTYESEKVVFSSDLDCYSSYYRYNFEDVYYEINISNLGEIFNNGGKYVFSLEKDGEVYQDVHVTIGGLTEEDKENNRVNAIINSNKETTDAIKEQTEQIKQNNETNKNIFQKIGEILSYINPFSENFFGKKLVDLILDGLKSLFVPHDGFFDTYFNDLKNWFSDRLGLLWTPFDLIIEILNRILNINFSEPIIHIPEIKEGFTNTKLISEYDYNLNSLLENDILKNVHNIYLLCVDAFVIFSLVNLARNKIEEVFAN